MLPFHVPYFQADGYAPGPQPYAPGVSYLPWRHTSATLRPWPVPVPTISAVTPMPVIARTRAGTAVNNRLAPVPSNYLFIGGIVKKSQG